MYACFLVEFTNSVQWQCYIVLLAIHSKDHNYSQRLQQQQHHQSSLPYRMVSPPLDHNHLDEKIISSKSILIVIRSIKIKHIINGHFMKMISFSHRLHLD